MESPKRVQNMTMGVISSMNPLLLTFSTPERWPCWKMKTSAP